MIVGLAPNPTQPGAIHNKGPQTSPAYLPEAAPCLHWWEASALQFSNTASSPLRVSLCSYHEFLLSWSSPSVVRCCWSVHSDRRGQSRSRWQVHRRQNVINFGGFHWLHTHITWSSLQNKMSLWMLLKVENKLYSWKSLLAKSALRQLNFLILILFIEQNVNNISARLKGVKGRENSVMVCFILTNLFSQPKHVS